jgi:hypothetical protein
MQLDPVCGGDDTSGKGLCIRGCGRGGTGWLGRVGLFLFRDHGLSRCRSALSPNPLIAIPAAEALGGRGGMYPDVGVEVCGPKVEVGVGGILILSPSLSLSTSFLAPSCNGDH